VFIVRFSYYNITINLTDLENSVSENK
jgi:hypothetical protein